MSCEFCVDLKLEVGIEKCMGMKAFEKYFQKLSSQEVLKCTSGLRNCYCTTVMVCELGSGGFCVALIS